MRPTRNQRALKKFAEHLTPQFVAMTLAESQCPGIDMSRRIGFIVDMRHPTAREFARSVVAVSAASIHGDHVLALADAFAVWSMGIPWISKIVEQRLPLPYLPLIAVGGERRNRLVLVARDLRIEGLAPAAAGDRLH